jgi:hypothetical protein
MEDDKLKDLYARKGELTTSIEILNNDLRNVNATITNELQRRQVESNGLREIVSK